MIVVDLIGIRRSEAESAFQKHLRRDKKSAEPILILKSESAFLRAIKDDLSITAAYPDVVRKAALVANSIRQDSDPSLPPRDSDEHFEFPVARPNRDANTS